jgi:hypothetical protein
MFPAAAMLRCETLRQRMIEAELWQSRRAETGIAIE